MKLSYECWKVEVMGWDRGILSWEYLSYECWRVEGMGWERGILSWEYCWECV